MHNSQNALADISDAQHNHHVITDIYQHVVQLQQQVALPDSMSFRNMVRERYPVLFCGIQPSMPHTDLQIDSWTHAHTHLPGGQAGIATPTAQLSVSWLRYFWHMFQGAILLALGLSAAGWILWKQFGERWWYLQQHRSAQAIEDMSNEDLHRLLGGKHVPSWVNFPDFQRVQWVNDVIGALSHSCTLDSSCTTPAEHCCSHPSLMFWHVKSCNYFVQYCQHDDHSQQDHFSVPVNALQAKPVQAANAASCPTRAACKRHL